MWHLNEGRKMVPLIVRQAVDRKIRRQISVLVGNYEYYYAVGLAADRIKLPVDGSTEPALLEPAVKEAVHAYAVNEDDPQEKYLCYLIERYEANSDFDATMTRLFLDGKRVTAGEDVGLE
jgi:hypothetical protein